MKTNEEFVFGPQGTVAADDRNLTQSVLALKDLELATHGRCKQEN